MYDVIVIGGGVIGGSVLRELTKYRLKVCLLEKAGDVSMGQSKANSGIVHAGFDAAEGSLKAKFNVEGNKLMYDYAKELGVKCVQNGSLVVAFSQEELQMLASLKERGERNGVPDLKIIDAAELKKLEPNISDAALGALYAPTAGIVCPYELTIAAVGNAMDNGAELYCDFEVASIQKENDLFRVATSDGRTVEGKLVINCAGLGAGAVAKMAGDDCIHIGARKGEYLLLDRESGGFVSHTLFFTPTKAGKGILIARTVDGNILLGPTSEEMELAHTETSAAGLAAVTEKALQMCPNVPLYNTITSFAGVRSYCDRHDFIIEESKAVKGLIHCAGIESPGLTSAPAIAKYVAKELVGAHFKLEKNPAFNGKRVSDNFFKDMTLEEKNALIAKDPAFGRIVCRCEQVTEGEILHAIKSNPPARNIDAVKRRTRSGMGRCQGGFCQPQIAELIAQELNIPLDEVTKSGRGSNLLSEACK